MRHAVILVLLLGLAGGSSGCKLLGLLNRDKPVTVQLSGFEAVRIAGVPAAVTVGEDFKVVIEGDEDLARQIDARVEDDTLVVTAILEQGALATDGPRVRVALPTLRRLQVSGTQVTVAGPSGPKLDVAARDGSTVVLNGLESRHLVLESGERSRIVVAGSASSAQFSLSGGSRGDARQLKVRAAKVTLSEASRLDLRPDRTLSGEASGASKLAVWGKPKRVGVATRDTSTVSYVR
jgi:hypothetical protein